MSIAQTEDHLYILWIIVVQVVQLGHLNAKDRFFKIQLSFQYFYPIGNGSYVGIHQLLRAVPVGTESSGGVHVSTSQP